MKKRAKVGLMAIAGLLGFWLWYLVTDHYGVGVDSVGWLPPEAHDVTYLRSYLHREAEFSIEREPFENWCAREGMPLRTLDGEGYHAIFQCLRLLENKGVMPPPTEPNELRAAERVVKVFQAGDLFYEERWSNGGGYSVGYDMKAKRGYFHFAHR
jgi:hypothetical protein